MNAKYNHGNYMVFDNSVIIKEFLTESFEYLTNISDELKQLEENSKDKELLNAVYRKVHTIKGSASFLGFKNLEKLTHVMENILDFVRDSSIDFTSDLYEMIQEGFDFCHDILQEIEASGNEVDKENLKLICKLTGTIEKGIIKESTPSEIRRLPDIYPSCVDVAEVPVKKNDNVKVLIEKESAPIEKIKEQLTEQLKVPNKVSAADSTVRVSVQLLDKIMNVVGELVINRNQILQYSKKNEDSELNRFAQQLNVITTELQTDIMTTRMQPVGSVFSKFERIVRDLARTQKKKIKLEIHGKDTELDKTLLEMIKDPMTHLIRNSVDHGLESPKERSASSKEDTGNLVIKAYHEGGQVIIEISDDGAGIDTKKVLEKAISKGLVSADEAQSISHQKILNFIFNPGFSTAEKVTSISGRGVGMDVVKSNVEKIGGEVNVTSTEGMGTTFKLKIPLTLAIVPALIVNSGGETFAIHQKNLVELVLLEEDGKRKIEELHGQQFFRLRGNLIPIFHLNKCLSVEADGLQKDIDVNDNIFSQMDNFLNVIVLKAEGRTYGLIVDEILDTQEIVVKPLGRKLKTNNIYAGATIMGDGKVSLIIDAFGFYNMVDRSALQQSPERTLEKNALSKNRYIEYIELLLFELDNERVYGIPLNLTSRLEEFKACDIEWSGNLPLIRYGNVGMPLINIGKVLNGKVGNDIVNDNQETFSCIVVQNRGVNFGFVVKRVLTIAETENNIEYDNVDRDGHLGIIYIEEKLITIVDVYNIISDLNLHKHSAVIATPVINGNVLLVEDSPLYLKIQKNILEEHGANVICAKSAREALDLLKEGQKVDLILTDIEMPQMTGWELTQEIRKNGNGYSEVPIIAVSNRINNADILKGKSLGLNSCVDKQDKKEVISAITNYLAQG